MRPVPFVAQPARCPSSNPSQPLRQGRRRRWRLVSVLGLALTLGACAGTGRSGSAGTAGGDSGGSGATSSSEVTHVVLFWLKDPGNEAHREQILATSRSFSDLPGVEEISVGVVVASERPIVDDSFDVGLVMRFRDADALSEYLVHPEHERAVREVLQPLVRRIVVHDFR